MLVLKHQLPKYYVTLGVNFISLYNRNVKFLNEILA
jgi:hypothetical protein